MTHKHSIQMTEAEQANRIWDALFIQNSPISEACRGVLTTLNALGLDVKRRDLAAIRKWFAGWKVNDYIDRCMELAGVRRICMTNSPFDDLERPVWEGGFKRDERFDAALRLAAIEQLRLGLAAAPANSLSSTSWDSLLTVRYAGARGSRIAIAARARRTLVLPPLIAMSEG